MRCSAESCRRPGNKRASSRGKRGRILWPHRIVAVILGRMPRPKSLKRTTKFTCPECGFRAAHAMGLGRHRTARHGVPSQRELKGKTGALAGRRDIARLERRMSELERKHDALLRSLRRAFGQASKAR